MVVVLSGSLEYQPLSCGSLKISTVKDCMSRRYLQQIFELFPRTIKLETSLLISFFFLT